MTRSILCTRIILLTLIVCYPVIGQSKNLPPAAIAVLDSAKVLRESQPAKSIENQINAYREQFRNATAAEEKILRDQQNRLLQQKSIMSKETFANESQKFLKKREALTRTVQQRTARLNASLRKAMYQLNKELIITVSKQSVELGTNLVIDRKELVFYATAIDITDKTIERLNKTLPDIKVKDPASIK